VLQDSVYRFKDTCVLQRVAAQVAVRCSVSEDSVIQIQRQLCIAACCSASCSVLQYVRRLCLTDTKTLVCCSVLQCTLRCVAVSRKSVSKDTKTLVYCSVLQCKLQCVQCVGRLSLCAAFRMQVRHRSALSKDQKDTCVLQRVAACCSVLQRVARLCLEDTKTLVCCSMLQCKLQCVAVCCKTLEYKGHKVEKRKCRKRKVNPAACTAAHCKTLCNSDACVPDEMQRTASRTATRTATCTATHCNTHSNTRNSIFVLSNIYLKNIQKYSTKTTTSYK